MPTSLIRASAFLRKEIFEIMRQPKLLLTLVAGPFVIMLLFGIGYSNNAIPLRILFVAEKGSAIEAKIAELAPNVTASLIYEGVSNDEAAALQRLRRGEVELVAVAPRNPYDDIRANRQAVFALYYNEIDPVQAGYINYLWQFFLQEVNRTLLEAVMKESQIEAANAAEPLKAVQDSARKMRESLAQADVATAQKRYDEIVRPILDTESAVTPLLNFLDNASASLDRNQANDAKEMRVLIEDSRKDAETLQKIEQGKSDYSQESTALSRIEARVGRLNTLINEYKRIEAPIIVRPLAGSAKNVSPVEIRITDFFAPAVIVLLLQHFMVTVSSLSLVRERQSGSIELFRASPLTPFETLLGKYTSYLLMGAALAIILTAVLMLALGVPMLGAWWRYAVIVAGLLFAALGFGCLISIVAETDSQAVQYAMLILLGSVFFGGAFLSLANLSPAVRGVSWALPATYAIQLLKQVMLKGIEMNPTWILWLLALGAGLFGLNLLLLRRKMAQE
ncbi:MAG: ABC transporter permease [Anaerolineae bacterium]|nr:ABC transporter permease [Anaerolineae bacterium]